MDNAKFIDYKTVAIILILVLLSTFIGLFIAYPVFEISIFWKIILSFLLLMGTAIFASRKLSERILMLTDELTESGVTIRTKKYRHQIDTTTEELKMLNRELKRRIYELHNLFQISLDLTAILDLDQLINSYLNTIIGQIRTKNAMLYLHDGKKSTELTLMRTKGIEIEELENLKFEITDVIVKQIYKKRQPVVIAEELTSLKEIEKFRMLDSEVIAPLIHSHRLEGLLILGSKTT